MRNHVVSLGETLWSIAKKYGIELAKLIANNPQLSNPNFILPGQIINIPSTGDSTYTVKIGDSLWTIANKHGIKLDDLIKANPDIKNPSLILPGEVISIPKGNGEPSAPTTPSGPDIPSAPTAPSVPSTPSTPSAPSDVTPSDITSLESEVIRLVNVEREKAGLPRLSASSELSRIARLKSQDFIDNNYLGHYSPKYGSPFDMMRSFGVSYTAAAENIASGQRTPAEVMNSWMNSSGHRSNILNSTYNQIGVGVARDGSGKLYWTQLFTKS